MQKKLLSFQLTAIKVSLEICKPLILFRTTLILRSESSAILSGRPLIDPLASDVDGALCLLLIFPIVRLNVSVRKLQNINYIAALLFML